MSKTKYTKRRDGRYLRQLKIGYKNDGTQEYKNIYGKTIAELENKVAEFISNRNKGIIIKNKKITLGDWAEKWLEIYQSNSEYNTSLMYQNSVRHIKSSNLAQVQLSKLTVSDFQDFFNTKISDGLTRTVEIIYITLNQMYERAIDREMLHINPLKKIKKPKIKSEPNRTLTELEEGNILIAPFTLKERVFIYLCLFAGLRKSEALALICRGTQNVIDLKNNTITVNKTLIFLKNGSSEIKDHPKSEESNRIIPIIEPLYSVLEEFMDSINQDYLFMTKLNTLTSQSSYSKMWKSIIKKLEITGSDLTSHMLRHTFATYLAVINVNPKIAQMLLGHSTIQMTMDVYTHLPIQSRYPDSRICKYYKAFLNLNQSKISQNSKSEEYKD